MMFSEWISVKERMPEEHPNEFAGFDIFDPDFQPNKPDDVSDEVLIAGVSKVNGERFTSCDFTVDGEWARYGNRAMYDITHWMHLPEPPKEEKCRVD